MDKHVYKHKKWIRGFSLIELMFVLFIVGILIKIGYGNYQQYLISSRRTNGQLALLELASQLEDYYAKNNTYKGATISIENDVELENSSAKKNWYQLVIDEQTDDSFSLQAIAKNEQALLDKGCEILTFNSKGLKGSIVYDQNNRKATKPLSCWS